MARVFFVIFCIGSLILENVFANPILASAFPNLPLSAITETCVDTVSPVIPQAIRQYVPSPNVLITDSSPSVCNNLANTLQLLVVSKLLQGNLGCGVPVANEILLPNGVIANGLGPIFSSPVVPGPVVNPNVISSPVLPNFVQNLLPNGLTSTTSCGCNTVLPQFGGSFIV